MRDPKTLVGGKLGPWHVERLLGAGAMGAVFEATQGTQRAALKVILSGHSASPTEKQRFVREAKAVNQIESDYVCGGLGFGEDEGLQWLALEFVGGRDLKEVLDLRGKLSAKESLDYGRQLLLGLVHAHAAGVVHRDLKPSNAILTAEGRVKLVDFGLARREDESMLLTAEGAVMGTPHYMSPEQVQGRLVDGRTDLYSLAHVLYHFFVGRPAYTGRNVHAILAAHIERTIPSVQELCPDAPGGLDRFLRKLGAVDLKRRYPDAQAALDALDHLLAVQAKRHGGRGLATSPEDLETGAATLPVESAATPPVEAQPSTPQVTLSGPAPALLPELPLQLLAGVSAGLATGLVASLAGLTDSLQRGGLSAACALVALVLTRRWVQGRNATKLNAQRYSVASLRQIELAPAVSAPQFSAQQKAKRLEQAGDDAGAAETLLECGDHGEAAKLFERAGNLVEAARIRAEIGQYLEAAELLIKARDPLGAARILSEHAAGLEARRQHEQRPRALARLDQELAKIVERASTLFRDEGELREAAKLLARVGRHRDAAELYLEAGAREEASQELIKAGDEKRAAELYERAGDVVAAARLQAPELLRQGDKAGAARAYEQVGDLALAARYYEEAGQLDRAVDLLERVGEAPRAAELHERLGHHLRAAELFEEAGDLFRAGRALEQADHSGRALGCYQQIPVGHADWGQAMRRIARLEDAGVEPLAPSTLPAVPSGALAPTHPPASAPAPESSPPTLLKPGPDPSATHSGAEARGEATLAGNPAEPGDPYAHTLIEPSEPDPASLAPSGSPAAVTFVGDLPEAPGPETLADSPATAASDDVLDPGATYSPEDERQLASRTSRPDDPGSTLWQEEVPKPEATFMPEDSLPPRPLQDPGGDATFLPEGEVQSSLAETRAARTDPDSPAPSPRPRERPPQNAAKRPSPAGSPARPGRPSGRRPRAQRPSAPTPTTQDPRRWIGQVVDRYRVRDLLGSGAFADVYRAEHVHLERPVALKILRAELAAREDLAERFLAEAKVVSRIRHPGVVEVYDFGRADGVPFMALELVEGTNLRDVLRTGPQPVERVVSLGRDLCAALGAAHAAGVIHRDLKPENVIVDREGRAHVLDFGMARVFWGTTRDEGAGFLGTPRYASPEAAAEGDVAAPADQYALGLILYELATGELPFKSSSTVGWLHHHRSTLPRPPRELRPDLPPALEECLLIALEKAPHQRYSDLRAFADELG